MTRPSQELSNDLAPIVARKRSGKQYGLAVHKSDLISGLDIGLRWGRRAVSDCSR
jgi:hypothetical protein